MTLSKSFCAPSNAVLHAPKFGCCTPKQSRFERTFQTSKKAVFDI
jgi:hypothetical protein